MAEQYFHPYYNQWDDGTIGTKNITLGEDLAVMRALKWARDRSEWSFHRPEDFYLQRGDPMNETGIHPKSFPDILQPKTQQVGVDIKKERYETVSKRFADFLERYHQMPAYEQAESSFDYPLKKQQLDEARVDLARQQRNLSNAEWLAFRDDQIEELRKTDPAFARDVDVVRSKAADLYRYGVAEDSARANLYSLEGWEKQYRRELAEIDKPKPDVFARIRIREIKEDLSVIKSQRENWEKEMKKISSKIKQFPKDKDFKSAHVNASNTLTKAGLNRPGVPLAGRLLSAPGIAADVSQIAAIAGVGPMKNYDNTGASYTNEEVVDVGGSKRVRSEVEELAAYHPDNAKNHPEISELDRINFFRKRGANEQVLSGLPGYKSWKAEQVQAEAEITKKLEMLNLNR